MKRNECTIWAGKKATNQIMKSKTDLNEKKCEAGVDLIPFLLSVRATLQLSSNERERERDSPTVWSRADHRGSE